jgi:tRNA threonylcarbamoyladenosine biosynthesis protein TsaE
MHKSVLSHSAIETHALGMKFGAQLPPNSVVCFFGDLGAGKTTFIKGLAAGLLGTNGDEVNSPTFTYLNIYRGKQTLYHFDLYRLRDADEFLSMGFDEVFDAGGVSCMEWSEKIEAILPLDIIRVEISHLGEDQRQIVFKGIHGDIRI